MISARVQKGQSLHFLVPTIPPPTYPDQSGDYGTFCQICSAAALSNLDFLESNLHQVIVSKDLEAFLHGTCKTWDGDWATNILF